MADPSVDIDFVRFFGRRLVDAETDERDCKVLDGTGSLALRADARLLAISNQHQAAFVGTKDGLSWAWMSELRAGCAPGAGYSQASAAALRAVPGAGAALGGAPFELALSAHGMQLALCGDRTVVMYDVSSLLQGGSAPTATHQRGGDGELLLLQASFRQPLARAPCHRARRPAPLRAPGAGRAGPRPPTAPPPTPPPPPHTRRSGTRRTRRAPLPSTPGDRSPC